MAEQSTCGCPCAVSHVTYRKVLNERRMWGFSDGNVSRVLSANTRASVRVRVLVMLTEVRIYPVETRFDIRLKLFL